MNFLNEQDTGDNIMKALQATCESDGAGFTVTLAAEKTSELSRQACNLAHARWSRGQRLVGTLQGNTPLPLALVKLNRTRRLWLGAREFLNMLDSPTDHQVNSETVLPHRAIPELAVLNAANALESLVILLDPPTFVVPVDLFGCLLVVIDFECGQQHPLDGFFGRRRIKLLDIDGPNTQRLQRRIAFRSAQLHWRKAHLQHTMARRSSLGSGQIQLTPDRHLL